MNFRVTAIFFGAVVVLVGALLVAALTEGEPAAGNGLVDPLTRAAIKPKDVDTIEIVRTDPAEQKLVFVRTGDNAWELREPVTAKADPGQAANVVRALFDAKPVPFDVSPSLAVHGLDKPTVRVTLKAGDKAATVNLGLTTIGGDRAVTFVTTDDRPNQPLAVRRADLAALFTDAKAADGPAAPAARWVTDYRLKRLAGADLKDAVNELKGVALRTDNKDLILVRGKPGTGWEFAAPRGYGKADTDGDPSPIFDYYSGVRPLLNAITNLQPAGGDDYIESPGDLAQYGLRADDPAAVRVVLEPEAGKREILYIGKAVEANGKPVVPAKVYAKLDGDSAVVKVAFDRLAALRKTITDPAVLRNRDLFPQAARERIDALDVTAGGSTFKLRKVPVGTGPKWVLYGDGTPQETKSGAVDLLVTALTKPRAAKDILSFPVDPAFAPAERKAEIKVWVGGTTTPEKADGPKPPPEPAVKGDAVTIIIGKTEGESVYVRRIEGGQRTDYKFAENLVALAAKGRFDYLDPRFDGFSPTVATKLAVTRGTAVTEVTKGKTGAWTFTQTPDAALKGQEADADKVAALLNVVASLSPDRVLAVGPTADDLKKFGLDPAAPRLKVAVGLPDNPDRVYDLGAETPDGLFVYAKQPEKPQVVSLAKVNFDRITSEDVRDTALFRRDPATVTKLKFRGWRKGPVPVELLFEKSADGWKTLTPAADYPADAAKIQRFLVAVSAPKPTAITPIVPGKSYGVNVEQDEGTLEITIQADKHPTVTLVLGSPAGAGARYAASSVDLGKIYTVPSASIDELTKDSAAFKK